MARKQKTIHYIYKTINLLNGKYYIGMHSTYNLEDGYMGSGRRLRASIRKYGEENFKVEILEFFETRELLIEAEKKLITPDMITDNNCMNIMSGGTGGFISVEQQQHRSSCANKKLNEKLKSDKKFYNMWRDSLVAGLKKAYRDAKLDRNNIKDGFKNKKHSDNSKLLMSETSKGMGVGKDNSQYGTCWITKEGINKKIKKEELETYLKDYWIKGRFSIN